MEIWRTRPVKILVLNHEYPPVGGGAATATFEIVRCLAAMGNEVTVVTSRYRGAPNVPAQDGVSMCRIWCLRNRPDRSSVFEMLTFIIAAGCCLPFILFKYRPAGAIAFFSLPAGALALAANMIVRLPYIVSLRGGDVPGLVPELGRLHKLLGLVRRCVLRRAVAVVANSEGLRHLSEEADKIPVRVMANGVDTDFFRPGSVAPSDRLRILFVGRFHEQKNVSLLFEQVTGLASGTFEIHLVGDGPQKHELSALARQLDVSASIVWHRWLSRASLLEVYQSVDCLVNPSSYEGMPNVVLEAMACALPVAASNIPGHNEVILNDETGLLFDLSAASELARVLERLRDVDLRRRLGANARAHVMKHHSWKNNAEQFANLFQNLTTKPEKNRAAPV